MNRRLFLSALGLALSSPCSQGSGEKPPEVIKPRRLRPGDTVVLVNPAGATFSRVDADIASEHLEALGLKVRRAPHLFDRRGYLAGSDTDRAGDINQQFADTAVGGLIALRGGWGCARILGLLDYSLIRAHPKVLLGFSDITALHMAIHSQTGLVTFHGPVGTSTWTPFTTGNVRQVVMEGQTPVFANPPPASGKPGSSRHRIRTIRPGRARGPLLGGNLTVLSAIMGSRYLPAWKGAILFLEDVGEEIYRVDRMLTQLKLAGVLNQIAGLVFGQCTDCRPGNGFGSLTLDEVLEDHLRPLGIPAWRGAMIGHIDDQLTLPLGVQAEIDAGAGTIRLLEPAVRM